MALALATDGGQGNDSGWPPRQGRRRTERARRGWSDDGGGSCRGCQGHAAWG